MAADKTSPIDDELKRINAEISKFKRDVVVPPKAVKPVDLVSTLKLAQKAEQETEKRIGKEIDEEVVKAEEGVEFIGRSIAGARDTGSLSFYFVISLAALGVMAYLFGSIATGVFYVMFGMVVWWFAHELHRSRSGHVDSFLSLGMVIVFLYLSYVLFDDLMGMLLCVIYALSFVIAAVLFFYHSRRELSGEIHQSFSRTFLVVFYAHIISFAAASLLAYFLPGLLLRDAFVSVTFLLVAWVFPSLLAYFFLNKFLYLRFFDRKHVLRDFSKALMHSVAYSAVFLALLVLSYLLTAMQFVGTEQSAYDERFNQVFTMFQDVRYEVEKTAFTDSTPELMGMAVSQDIVAMSGAAFESAALAKTSISAQSMSLYDYSDDNYFTILVRNRMLLNRVWLNATEMDELKSDLLREYRRMKSQQEQKLFDDGTTSLEEHYFALAGRVSDAKARYSEPSDLKSLRKRFSDPNSYGSLFGDGELVMFATAHYPDLGFIQGGKSAFGGALYDVATHTVLLRDIIMLLFDTVAVQSAEVVDPYSLRVLYRQSPGEELVSKVLRYRIIWSNQDALLNAG